MEVQDTKDLILHYNIWMNQSHRWIKDGIHFIIEQALADMLRSMLLQVHIQVVQIMILEKTVHK